MASPRPRPSMFDGEEEKRLEEEVAEEKDEGDVELTVVVTSSRSLPTATSAVQPASSAEVVMQGATFSTGTVVAAAAASGFVVFAFLVVVCLVHSDSRGWRREKGQRWEGEGGGRTV